MPYPAQCKLSLFGNGMEPRSVVLEGARLSQPDGLWLDDAFPQMKEGAGLYGLFVELQTPQPRVNIEASACVMELHSSLHLTRFGPARLGEDGCAARRGALPLIQDAFQTSSVVLVNGSDEAIRPGLRATCLRRVGRVEAMPIAVPSIGPRSVAEVPLPASFFDEIEPQECSYGLLRMAGVELETELPAGIAVFMLYRDASTTQPVSICGL